jgi:hypothetical protein
MNAYHELKKKQDEEMNRFPMFFAFSNKQFDEGMAKFGFSPDDTGKIYRFGNTGGYYPRAEAVRLHEMLGRFEKNLKDAIEADTTGEGFIFDMFDYTLADHEYGYTHDTSSALDALDLTKEQIKNNPLLLRGFELAKKNQLEKQGY